MDVAITGSTMLTALGGAADTYKSLVEGRSGIQPLSFVSPDLVNVRYGYHLDNAAGERRSRASGWLAECVTAAAREAGVDCSRQRIVAIVGTGLRELRGVER